MTEAQREELNRRIHQFLVHSYLYYVLNESIVSDHHYDFICNRLAHLAGQFPDADAKYFDLAKGVETSGSGFYIQEYPPAIVTIALKSLWMHKKHTIPGFSEDFPGFISRWGKKLEA